MPDHLSPSLLRAVRWAVDHARMSAAAEKLIAKARRFNARLDKIDRDAGNATPSAAGPLELVTTARSALMAALTTLNWDTAAEAYVFLDDFIERLKHGSRRS